jgi:hypothetical protein
MNGEDVWGGEMPNLPFRRRHGDPADAAQLDELLAAGQAAPEWQSVSDLLRSAAAAAEPSELAGEAAVLAAFRRAREGDSHRRPQPIARCKTVLSTLLTGRIAVGITAGVVTLTGAATAAYACVLPSPIQSFAHDTIGAPAPSTSGVTAVSAAQAARHGHDDADRDGDPSATPSVTVSGSATATASATKAAATASTKPLGQQLLVFRLCKEYTADAAAGKTLNQGQLALLVKAAGSTASITAFCAALPPLPTMCPSVVASDDTPGDTRGDGDTSEHGAPFCGLCPELKQPTTTAAGTATASASSNREGHSPFNCGDRGRGHVVDPRVIPLPTINHDDLKSPEPGDSENGDHTSGHGDSVSGGHGNDGSGHN